MDRLNTRNILKRKDLAIEGNNYNCVLCSLNREETAFHFFFSCPFSQQCWNFLGFHWDFHREFFEMMEHERQQQSLSFFMDIFIMTAWHIWKQRNNFIFNRSPPSFLAWKLAFRNEVILQAIDGKLVIVVPCSPGWSY